MTLKWVEKACKKMGAHALNKVCNEDTMYVVVKQDSINIIILQWVETSSKISVPTKLMFPFTFIKHSNRAYKTLCLYSTDQRQRCTCSCISDHHSHA